MNKSHSIHICADRMEYECTIQISLLALAFDVELVIVKRKKATASGMMPETVAVFGREFI
ncbi:hypothetical protein DRQ00_02470 [candidate division KSB1 bacterium]|nr:MAG: hypothetical protein DRQ00_02470 [candidate division KSB1 bacterium]